MMGGSPSNTKTVTLSKYDIEVTPDRKQITQISNPRRDAHPFRSAQLTLIDVSPSEWRLYWRQHQRTYLGVGKAVPLESFELPLFDLAVGAEAAGQVFPRPHLHLMVDPDADAQTDP